MMAHTEAGPSRTSRRSIWGRRIAYAALITPALAAAAVIPLTLADFHVSGTQIGDVQPWAIWSSDDCFGCHGSFDPQFDDPYSSWSGSLMAQAGRDPLFFAQLATANQDAANAGYFCLRCHVPVSVVTGHVADASGDSLDHQDLEGVSCHFCHSMVDPVFKPGISPPEDEAILAALVDVPSHFGNAMFVLDPMGNRRGPRADAQPLHEFIYSPFHRSGDFCGTCHDVGNVAVSLQPNGTYRYNAIGEPTPDEDLWSQFPLERTYSEWKLSAFANGGVDMGGRFGGVGASVVSTCQDCHMPKAVGAACAFTDERPDLARHDFAGASSWVLEIIKEHYAGDPEVDPAALDRGIAAAQDMLARAATLGVEQRAGVLGVRVTNESGHKLPTGHIEGRRVFINVLITDAGGAPLREYGGYDSESAILDEETTTVYEMHVGLSKEASALTGFPAGVTTHMALADTIEKDNRIPPRGFTNETYAEAGAPVVGWAYADGQHWDDSCYRIPEGGARAEVRLLYQTVTRHYIEALRDYNTTNAWGDILHDLWERTDKGAPVLMASATIDLSGFQPGDVSGEGHVGFEDLNLVLSQYGMSGRCLEADLDGDEHVSFSDLNLVLSFYGAGGAPGE